jgi:hypothetical protein
MAATILNTSAATEVSVCVVRAFVRLRETLTSSKRLAAKLKELERKLDTHDQAIAGIFETIQQLMQPAAPKRRQIGFVIAD